MPSFYPLVGCIAKAALDQGELALSKLALFQSTFTPGPNTVLADLTAVGVECDYDGYTTGGKTITAFNDPGLDPAGGAAISSPLVQFDSVPTGPPPVTNLVGGWFLTTAGGDLWAIGTFVTAAPMGGTGNILPLVIKLVEATGA